VPQSLYIQTRTCVTAQLVLRNVTPYLAPATILHEQYRGMSGKDGKHRMRTQAQTPAPCSLQSLVALGSRYLGRSKRAHPPLQRSQSAMLCSFCGLNFSWDLCRASLWISPTELSDVAY